MFMYNNGRHTDRQQIGERWLPASDLLAAPRQVLDGQIGELGHVAQHGAHTRRQLQLLSPQKLRHGLLSEREVCCLLGFYVQATTTVILTRGTDL